MQRYAITTERVIRSRTSVGNSSLRAQQTITVSYEELQNKLQTIARSGAKIAKIEKLNVVAKPNNSAVLETAPVKWNSDATPDEKELVINTVYRQLFGNAYYSHVDRALVAESRLKNDEITVREFVRLVAKSDAYKKRFFYPMSQVRFVELNVKHLLGRAIYDQAEMSEHVCRYNNSGYDTDIDSYLDSEDYNNAFGDDTVPYLRGFITQPGQSNINYPHSSQLYLGVAGSDRLVTAAQFPVI
ncbi:phycobilisome rod-core linker polypeptide [Candidatus Cyanaurora vandensis]|uniref:phycobilisome rod-core linker polypeptide n=1 Tax=Candidatus Cyanaurora vandensis TaxID=2714958 RepID=UPI00257F4CE8|nr:phycobilisome rod-core linker polypeptide [Candidatus Cyanaurora vandensis]